MITFTRPEVWQPALRAWQPRLTPFVSWLARRIGMVSAPSKDRWHTRPTALLGGVGIFVAVVTVVLLAVDVRRRSAAPSFRGRAAVPDGTDR
jgi:UDP-N-acetylmuramyl pentapeptide phosphotransferase/UDP-N-acetylglucosamine-1-phosphate transferase